MVAVIVDDGAAAGSPCIAFALGTCLRQILAERRRRCFVAPSWRRHVGGER